MKNMWVTLHEKLFYITILLLPFALAKRFVLPSSYVSGIYTDFLTPSFYLFEVFMVLMLVAYLSFLLHKNVRLNQPLVALNLFQHLLRRSRNKFGMTVIFILSLLLSSQNIVSYIFVFRNFLYFFFAIYVYLNFSSKNFHKLKEIISLSILFQSILGIFQFLKGGSVFNNYLMFGEFPYSYKTPAIMREVFLGKFVIPPYGTFPHPNILGGFLSVFLVLLLFLMKRDRPSKLSVYAFILGVVALALTVSIPAWVSFLIGVVFIVTSIHWEDFGLKFWNTRGRNLVFVGFLVFLVGLNLGEGGLSFLKEERPLSTSFSRRLDLLQISKKMILETKGLGVGTGAFTKNMEKYGVVSGNLKFLEPVHNIYFLLLAESGVFSFSLFAVLILFVFYAVLRGKKYKIFLIMLCQLLFLGTFDHYLLTYPQGLFLFWLTLGFALSTMHINE